MKKNKSQILEGITEDIKSSKFIANNTLMIHYKNGITAYRLHNTDIIRINTSNGNITLNNGGYKTSTTKNRINQFTPSNFYLYQKNHIWYINTLKEKFSFYNGITFDLQGNLLSENKTVNIKEVNKIKKSIKKYVNLIDKCEKIPVPSNGDCWYCSMKVQNTGKNLGDKIQNIDHLKSHIKENYLHGSILYNAMIEYGYNTYQIGIHYNINSRDTFKRALKKYLYKRLLKDNFNV